MVISKLQNEFFGAKNLHWGHADIHVQADVRVFHFYPRHKFEDIIFPKWSEANEFQRLARTSCVDEGGPSIFRRY